MVILSARLLQLQLVRSVCASRSSLAHFGQTRRFAEQSGAPPTVHPPAEPGPEDCCNSGCERCVWTQYHEAVAEFTARNSSGPDTERSRLAAEAAECAPSTRPLASDSPSTTL